MAIHSPRFAWFISSPLPQFSAIVLDALQRKKKLNIADCSYDIAGFQYIKSPVFNENSARFTCLSPVTLIRNQSVMPRGRLTLHNFVLPGHSDFETVLLQSVLAKYNLFRSHKRKDIDFQIVLDEEYLERRQFKVWKLIALEKTRNEVDYVRGFLAPFQIISEPDVLKLIYDSGLGEYNGMGFGMVERIQDFKEVRSML